jgi:hypothetical protein
MEIGAKNKDKTAIQKKNSFINMIAMDWERMIAELNIPFTWNQISRPQVPAAVNELNMRRAHLRIWADV